MFLLFASDDPAQKLYIGILSGDTAVVLHDWLSRDDSIPDSITLNDIPTVRFSAAQNQDNHQQAEWIRAKVYMDRVTVPTWTWPSTRTRMPPTPPHTVRYFQIAVGNTQTFTCSGFTASTGPILSTTNTAVPADNQISLLEAHLLQLANPAPIPDVNIAPTLSNKRRRTSGGN